MTTTTTKSRWLTIILGTAMTACLLAGPAAAGENRQASGSYRPGSAQLSNAAIRTFGYSWNGVRRDFPVPRPTTTPRRPTRVDPMATSIYGQPGSKYAIQRQSTPNALGRELSSIKTFEQAEQAALGAMKWKAAIGLRPDVLSANQPYVHTTYNEKKVYWPGSVVRTFGKTRDGQRIAPQYRVHEGLPQSAQQVLDFSNQPPQLRQYLASGHHLPSAPVKMTDKNLLVSAPVKNVAQVAQGEAELKSGERKLRAATFLQEKINRVNQQIQSGAFNDKPQLLQRMQKFVSKATPRIPVLQNEGNQLKQAGEKNVAAGTVLRSVVLSVGAFSNALNIQAVNPRLAAENAPQHTASARARSEAGYFRADVAATAEDLVQLTVSNPAISNQKVASQMNVQLKVPNHERLQTQGKKPVTVIDGIPFYPAKIVDVEVFNQNPVPLPN